jgi:hypothetical protein
MNIVTSLSNPQYSLNNHRGLEIVYLKKLFIENNLDLDIIGKKGRTNKDITFFKDITTNLDSTENIFLQLAPINFFGGVLDEYIVKFMKNIGNLKHKNFYVLVNDPRIKPQNPAEVVFNRFGLCEEYIDHWNYIFENATFCFQGKYLNKFFNENENRKIMNLDFFTYIFKNDTKYSSFIDLENKEFDLIYYGDKRGSHREKKINKFVESSKRNLLVGYKTNKIDSTFMNKVSHNELKSVIDKSICSLIIGDKEHENNIATFRLYETLASSTLCAIDIDYDPNKELIKNEVLKNVLYVKNTNDIKKLCSLYSKELIDLQQLELKRIFEQGNYELNIQTNGTIKEQFLLF